MDPVSLILWMSLVIAVAMMLPTVILMATILIVTIGSLFARRRARQRHMRKVLGRLVELAAVAHLRPMSVQLVRGRRRAATDTSRYET